MDPTVKHNGIMGGLALLFLLLGAVFIIFAGIAVFDLFRFLYVHEPMNYAALHVMGYCLMIFGIVILLAAPYLNKARKAERKRKAAIIQSVFQERLDQELKRREINSALDLQKQGRVERGPDGGIL